MPAKPGPSRDRQRQRLIDACISALHVHGPSNTTVERVTAIARMSPGIVRFYFESKAAMLLASLQFLAEEFEQQLLIPVARLKADPVAALTALVELYLDPQIASPRKVSVWYSFWGEASSRAEYFELCGQKDANFTALTQDLVGRMIRLTGATHLDGDAVALGLIGVLEVLWQDIAFQDEKQIDRPAVRRRAMSYLKSVFPGYFAGQARSAMPEEAGCAIRQMPSGDSEAPGPAACWWLAAHVAQLAGNAELKVRIGPHLASLQLTASGLVARWSDPTGGTIESSERDGFIFLRVKSPGVD